MILSFHRSRKMAIRIGKPGQVRAFVFDVALGVTKASEPQVDPESGMLLNLVKVDEILAKLESFTGSCEWSSFAELLNETRKHAETLLQKETASLSEISFNEKRGFFVKWHQVHLMGYEEILELDQELFKVRCESNFSEEDVCQQLAIVKSSELFSDELFEKNLALQSLEVEALASGLREQKRRFIVRN